jgi:hypothetical protein
MPEAFDLMSPSDAWTTAPQTRDLFVLLTIVAVPWFIARLLRRFGWSGRQASAAGAALMRRAADLHGLFMRVCRYLSRCWPTARRGAQQR